MRRKRRCTTILVLGCALGLAAGCGDDGDDGVRPDTTPPAAITDLSAPAGHATSNAITLIWTAPAAKADVTAYDIRYSTDEDDLTTTAARWNAAAQPAEIPAPSAAGEPDTCVVGGLDPETQYYFGIKSSDQADNWSAAAVLGAETPEVTPDVTAPATIADLEAHSISTTEIVLSWTAPADNGAAGHAADAYEIRWSTSSGSGEGWWTAATALASPPTPSAPGTDEEFTVTGLDPETEYRFAIKTSDEVPNASGVSNVEGATTWQDFTQLTTDGLENRNPCWSADGTTICFQSFAGGNKDIYTIPAAGGARTRITDFDEQEQDPFFSPNGTEIAFHSPHATGHIDILVKHSDGTGSASVLTNTAQKWNIYLVDRTVPFSYTQLTNTAGDDGQPDWHPDGQHVAFKRTIGSNDDIYQVTIATGTHTALVTDGQGWTDEYPSYSPDGAKLAFCSTRTGDREVWILTIATGALVQITDSLGRDNYPDWSPDGRFLVFTSHRGGADDLWTIQVAE
jgi:Tol biopolymer transport system component